MITCKKSVFLSQDSNTYPFVNYNKNNQSSAKEKGI